MKIINQKERRDAKWRFAGLYLIAVAIPAFFIINGLTVKTVDNKDTTETLNQLKNRDQAVKEVYQLAGILSEMHRLKPPYATDFSQNEKHDRLRLKFETEADRLQKKYYRDTVAYKLNYGLVAFLENNHNEYEKTEVEYGKLYKELEVIKNNPASVSGNDTEVRVLQGKLESEREKISDLKQQLANTSSSSGQNIEQLQDLRQKCSSAAAKIDIISARLHEIEQEASGIKTLSNNNNNIKDRILGKVQAIKSDAAEAKNMIAD